MKVMMTRKDDGDYHHDVSQQIFINNEDEVGTSNDSPERDYRIAYNS